MVSLKLMGRGLRGEAHGGPLAPMVYSPSPVCPRSPRSIPSTQQAFGIAQSPMYHSLRTIPSTPHAPHAPRIPILPLCSNSDCQDQERHQHSSGQSREAPKVDTGKTSCPREAVGRIIGPRGITIQDIQARSWCTLDVKQDVSEDE